MFKRKFTGIIIFICAIGGFLLMVEFLNMLSRDDDACEETFALTPVASAHNPVVATIIFTDTLVSPFCSVVVSGGKVVWINSSKGLIQVSSDPHPIHSDNSEISEGKFVLDLEPGQSASVILTRKGIFGFHDHLKPNLRGKIRIQ